MAWTAPRTWTTSELVTAAFMNTHVRDNLTFLKGTQVDSEVNSRTFTNTSYLDLDALTGGSGTITAVAVTADTDTAALVHLGALVSNDTGGATTRVSYRVSGDTTVASSDTWGVLYESGNANDQSQMTQTSFQTSLTAGSNTFEAQARVSAGTGSIARIYLAVTPI